MTINIIFFRRKEKKQRNRFLVFFVNFIKCLVIVRHSLFFVGLVEASAAFFMNKFDTLLVRCRLATCYNRLFVIKFPQYDEHIAWRLQYEGSDNICESELNTYSKYSLTSDTLSTWGVHGPRVTLVSMEKPYIRPCALPFFLQIYM